MIFFASSGSPETDWWGLFGPASSLAVAIVGWWIVERFARSRERRDDLRRLMSGMEEALSRIVQDATTFYCLDGKDPKARALALGLKSKISALAENLQTLREGGTHVQADVEIKALRQIITGGAFDSAIRPPCPPDAKLIHGIALAAEDLRLKIGSDFYRALIGKVVRKK